MAETETKRGETKRPLTFRSILSAVVLGVGAVGLAQAAHSADLDGDGTVDQADLDVLISQFNQSGTFSADLNHNGGVGSSDAGILFSSWGVLPPPPPSGRGPQLLTTPTGHGGFPAIDSTNVATYASRYDVLTGYITASQIATLRSLNPDIILLQYWLYHSRQSQTAKPTSYYVKDAVTGSNVQKNGWYLLDIRQAAVRSELVTDTIAAATSPSLDGWWLDVTGPDYVNCQFTTCNWYQVSNPSQVADLGDLDGSWVPGQALNTRPASTDAVWPLRNNEFLTAFNAAIGSKIFISNAMKSQSSSQAFWQTQEDLTAATADGLAKEALFTSGSGYQSETTWKFFLDRIKATLDSGKYFHVHSYDLQSTLQGRTFVFGTYLLIADGQKAWLRVATDVTWGETLYNTDYGTPLAAYETITTPDGPIYKRRFTKANVWVNPGTNTRTGDGKTLGPNTAIIETTP